MLSSIFLKMLRGGLVAPSGYRPSNDQPTASRDLHTHLDMLLTTADLIRSAHAKASRFPMTFAAPRFTSETPTSAHAGAPFRWPVFHQQPPSSRTKKKEKEENSQTCLSFQNTSQEKQVKSRLTHTTFFNNTHKRPTPSPYGATPPYPGAGRETHRPTARRPPTRGRAVKCIEKSSPGWMVFPQPPELPLRKRGVLRCVGRGGGSGKPGRKKDR